MCTYACHGPVNYKSVVVFTFRKLHSPSITKQQHVHTDFSNHEQYKWKSSNVSENIRIFFVNEWA